MGRMLFCELGPLPYRLSALKCRTVRRMGDALSRQRFAVLKSDGRLPVALYSHRSLIRRTLGSVDMRLQDNKAINLALAAPRVSGVLIRPGETFSFWRLVGRCSAKKGYREGLTISSGSVQSGIGGGMCQFTNLIHWMVLHTPLTVTEHHHHDGFDLFPDFGRQIPFGTGTSVCWNYLDYRFQNDTPATFQLIVSTDDQYLCGQLLCDRGLDKRYHIRVRDEFFSCEGGVVYRNGTVLRDTVDPRTGELVKTEILKKNHARVLYDTAGLDIVHP